MDKARNGKRLFFKILIKFIKQIYDISLWIYKQNFNVLRIIITVLLKYIFLQNKSVTRGIFKVLKGL